jgi:2',3'-cyclic-nucleotide 2'-phosphodiesterase (5'-nucleotidase family)
MIIKPKAIFLVFLFLAELSCAAEEPAKISILQTTDLHGYVLEDKETPGLLKLASLIKREYVPGSTLLVDCGDSFQGSFAASVSQGAIMDDALNGLGYDVWVPGNHDFDWGPKRFLELGGNLHMERLAANLKIYGKTPEGFKAWTLFKRNGIKIAIIGMTSPYLEKWLWGPQLEGLEVRGVAESVDKLMPEVLGAEPDLIVLAMHGGKFAPERLGGDDGPLYALARRHPEINLILGGHTHQEEPGERLGQNTWFAQAGQHAQQVLRVEIEFDQAKKRISSLKSQLLNPGAEKPDAALAKLLEKPLAEVDAEGAREIASLSRRLGPEGRGKSARNSLSEFICRAMAEASGARIAFHAAHSGASLGPGAVTEKQLRDAIPYENRLGTLELSPSQCKAILEEQAALKDKARAFTIWGLSYSIDKEGRLNGPLKLADGSVWDDETKRVKAAFSGYDLASSGGRLPKLAEIAATPEAKPSDSGLWTRDALRLLLQREAGLQSQGQAAIFSAQGK